MLEVGLKDYRELISRASRRFGGYFLYFYKLLEILKLKLGIV